MHQGGLIHQSDMLVRAAGVAALQVEEIGPKARSILFRTEDKPVMERIDQTLTYVIKKIGKGAFTYRVIPEKMTIVLNGIEFIDPETWRLGGGWEFLIGNGRWSIQKRLVS